MMFLISALLVSHYLGDFLLQTNRMALNKSKWNQSWEGFYALFYHALTYTSAFLIIPATHYVMGGLLAIGVGRWLVFLLATFLLHFLTDALTSKMTSKWWFIPIRPLPLKLEQEFGSAGWSHFCRFDMRAREMFFTWIGRDQLIHQLCLIWTFWLLFA